MSYGSAKARILGDDNGLNQPRTDLLQFGYHGFRGLRLEPTVNGAATNMLQECQEPSSRQNTSLIALDELH
jgi:hypothetical protein